jgi:hypothetical protein
MWVSPSLDFDVTVLAYSSQSQLDVFDHTYFNRQTVDLEEPCTAIAGGTGYVVAYNDASDTHDVYRVDLDGLTVTEYVVANPVQSLALLEADGAAYAVATLRPESENGGGLDEYQDQNYGLAVMDLADDEATNLVLQSEPVGLALTERDGRAWALVLLQDIETLLMIDLAQPSSAVEIELPAPPVAIGSMPDGSFTITHDSPLGLVTFLDPASPEDLKTASGFAVVGLFDEYELPRLEEDK